MQLYNKQSADERRQLITEAGLDRLTLSFYKYHQIKNPKILRDHLFMNWNEMDVLGRIYIANEGINAQLSVPTNYFQNFKKFLDSISFLKGIRLNIGVEQNNHSFLKLTVKVREKILADGLDNTTFDLTRKGIHVNAEEFNDLLFDSDIICVDMRNHYESEIGHFKGAVTPDVDTFRESLPLIEQDLAKYKDDKSLLIYCTGGIRCEKASAYFMHKGFKNVFQLEGGIIEYARQVSENDLENHFIGKNFVFDGRRGEQISKQVIAKCHQCGIPCDCHVNCANEACNLLFIQCDSCREKRQTCCSDLCQEIVNLPDDEQRKRRKGRHNSNKIFKKGRSEVLKFRY